MAAKVKRSNHTHWGFNRQTEQYEDLVKAGVIDPTKLVRTALTNAASIASLLLMTEALVSEISSSPQEVSDIGTEQSLDQTVLLKRCSTGRT